MNFDLYDIQKAGGISEWDEGIPLGNGKLGVLLYGTDVIRMSLDRVDLWDTRPAPETLEKGFTYQNLQNLVISGTEDDWNEFKRLFNDLPHVHAYPSKITAGRIEFFFEDSFSPSFYLSLETAVASVTDKAGNLRMSAFADASDHIGVLRMFGDYRMEYHSPRYISTPLQDGQPTLGITGERGIGYPPVRITKMKDAVCYWQSTSTAFEYGILVLEKKCGEWDELYFSIITNRDSEDCINAELEHLRQMAEKGYDALLEKHCAWWRSYWAKSKINVSDPMIEAVYYRSNYLFGSCSRKGGYPMALQGVWTADNDLLPPWKGDYHYDLNVQLSYQAYLKANHLPEGEVLLDYLWSLRDVFRAHARDFYGVEGLLIPGTASIEGQIIGGWPQYTYTPTMSAWMAQSFDEYYKYTGDEMFLKERAYPFFTEIGKAIEGLLIEKNGRLYLPLSASPEIHNNNREAYLTPNSNCDLALMRYLYITLSEYASKLNELEAAKHWGSVLSRLDDIAIDDQDRILLSPDEALTVSHRHFSHLLCLYPLHLINYRTARGKQIYDRTLYELEVLGTGNWVGYSFASAAQIYAMAENGNGAYQKLYSFAHGFVSHNGFHLNGDFKHYGYSRYHYRPFTLEGSFAFCDALHEMLLQDHDGSMYLFPAIPDEWKNRKISFTTLRSRGGVLVSAERNSDGSVLFSLRSQTEQTLKIANSFATKELYLRTDCNDVPIQEYDGKFVVHIPANTLLVIRSNREMHYDAFS